MNLSGTTKKLKYCSPLCLKSIRQANGRRLGLQTATLQLKRSKNEKLFATLCEELDSVLTNEPMFNKWDADVILLTSKVAVLWNGPWHYRKITKKHSVEQVQNRDRIKIGEIEKAGYLPYIIRDDGSYDPKFVHSEFEKFKRWFGELAITRLS